MKSVACADQFRVIVFAHRILQFQGVLFLPVGEDDVDAAIEAIDGGLPLQQSDPDKAGDTRLRDLQRDSAAAPLPPASAVPNSALHRLLRTSSQYFFKLARRDADERHGGMDDILDDLRD